MSETYPWMVKKPFASMVAKNPESGFSLNSPVKMIMGPAGIEPATKRL
jgi:hypothetical protein